VPPAAPYGHGAAGQPASGPGQPPYPQPPYGPPSYLQPPPGQLPQPGPPGPLGRPDQRPPPPPDDRLGLALAFLGVVLLVLAGGAFLLLNRPQAVSAPASSPTPVTAASPANLSPSAIPTPPPPTVPPVATPRPSSAPSATIAATASAPATSAPATGSPPPGASGSPAHSSVPPSESPAATGQTPSPGATGSSAPTAIASASAGPVGSSLPIDPAVAAQIAQIEQQVAALRGIQPTRDVPNRLIDQDQLRAELQQQFDTDNPSAVIGATNDLYKRLGLLPQDADLRSLALDLYSTQVAGFYDTKQRVFTIISRGQPFGPADRIIVAHEYTHALQDMAFDLSSSEVADVAEGDQALGRLALVEGDATLSMSLWALQNLTPEELAQAQVQDPTAQAVLDRMPLILRRELLFPYVEGAVLVQNQYLQGGGYRAIDAMFQKLPKSTEQVIHPEKYTAGEAPVEVKPADLSGALGAGWKRSIELVMGELGTQIWAANGQAPQSPLPGLPPVGTIPGGDRVASYDGPDGAWAIVWETVWDTEQDAQEFAAAAPTITMPTPAGEVQTLDDGGQPSATGKHVRLLFAKDAATLDAVKQALAAPTP
jgi:hypothetical protein